MPADGAKPHTPKPHADAGCLAQNIVQFGRVLRAAGLPVGPGHGLRAVDAARAVGPGNRMDFYWALHAVFVTRRDQRIVFDQAFHVFWRNPRLLERMMSLVLLETKAPATDGDHDALNRRVTDALYPGSGAGSAADRAAEDRLEIDAHLTFSDQEVLKAMDFEQMSAEEEARARRLIRGLRLPVAETPTRRQAPDPRGHRVDMRRSLRASLRGGGAAIALRHRSPRHRPPPLVVLCDISGSMSRYSRIILHFLHAVGRDRDRVHSFLFGTRLTNITRPLRRRDVDEALAGVAEAVEDWSGGTRIGESLHAFNQDWARRVLGQGAIVLLITDGLDRAGGAGLAREMERLHKSCRRLIWINPLLRYAGYAPKSQGAQAMIRHVDDLRAGHSLESLEDWAALLSTPAPRRRGGVAAQWLAPVEAVST